MWFGQEIDVVGLPPLVRLNHRFHRLTARPDNIQLLQGRGDYPPPPTVDLEGEVEMQVRRRERGGAPDQ